MMDSLSGKVSLDTSISIRSLSHTRVARHRTAMVVNGAMINHDNGDGELANCLDSLRLVVLAF